MQRGKVQEVSLEELVTVVGERKINWEVDLGCAKIQGVEDTVTGDFVAVSTCEGRGVIIK